MDTLEKFKNGVEKIKEWLGGEISSLRVGRATPAIVENVLIDCYGTKTPLKQVASISAPEPRILVIEPWDKSILSPIEKAILSSNLGLNPIVDKNLIRITIPPLTEERRDSLIKILNIKLEEAKIKVRTCRDEAVKEISELFGGKKITEDERFKMREKVQKIVEEINMVLESLTKTKEKEIKTQ